MNFPTSFPVSEMSTLVDFFGANSKSHTIRDYAEAAWVVEGYVLNQMVSNPAPEDSKFHQHLEDAHCQTNEEKAEILKDCRVHCVASTPEEQRVSKGTGAVDWSQILAIVVAVLQQIGPLLGK